MIKSLTLRTWQWCSGQGFSQCPSSLDTTLDGASSEPKAVVPFYRCEANVIVNKPNVRALVPLLLCSRSPVAIFWRVWPVVISTVQLMLRRGAWPHISKEGIEETPSISDGDASCTVVDIPGAPRIETASLHGAPDVIFRCMSLAVSWAATALTILLQRFSGRFLVQTATRPYMAVSHITQTDDGTPSATAPTPYHAFSTRIATDNGLNREAASGESNQFTILNAFHMHKCYHSEAQIATVPLAT